MVMLTSGGVVVLREAGVALLRGGTEVGATEVGGGELGGGEVSGGDVSATRCYYSATILNFPRLITY